MPPIRLSISERCAFLAASISFNREIMSPYSCYIKKGLVYIAITDLFRCQPSFYIKYTKLNIYILCDMCLVSLNKCTFFYYTYYYAY